MKPIHDVLRERAFFRKVSNSQLRRFFERHRVLGEIEWDSRGEADIKDIHEAYTELSAPVRNRLVDDLEYINDLASQRGMPCLVDAAYQWNVDCKDMTAHDLAMLLFLDYRDAFDTAHSWWTLNHFQGYRDFRGRGALRLSDPEKGKAELETAFSKFMSSPAKAVEVQVDVYKDSNKLAYVVTHEDYVQPVERFKDHELVVIRDRPVFYATMVYYPNLGKLKVKASKGEMVEFARDSFAEHILHRNDFFRHAEVSLIYDFERFKQPWRFETDSAADIEWVRVVGLRFKPDRGVKTLSR